MAEKTVVTKARDFLSETLDKCDQRQWEYNGALALGVIESLDSLIMNLEHRNPNARILACRILGDCADLYNAEQAEKARKALEKRSSDSSMAEISGGFQCEEEETERVKDYALESLSKIKKYSRVSEAYLG